MEGGLRDDDDASRACNSHIIEMVQVKHSPDDEKSLTFPSITISVSSSLALSYEQGNDIVHIWSVVDRGC